MATTLQGATIAFGTTSFVANITSGSLHEATRDAVDDTNITDTSAQYVPSLIVDYGSMSIDFEYDQSAAVEMPIDQAAETITFTFPLKSGEGTAATVAGTGFVTSAKYPDIETKPSSTARASMSIQWSSKPTYTAGGA